MYHFRINMYDIFVSQSLQIEAILVLATCMFPKYGFDGVSDPPCFGIYGVSGIALFPLLSSLLTLSAMQQSFDVVDFIITLSAVNSVLFLRPGWTPFCLSEYV